jgi:pimeloyl-ACP methyl ester carboxylesterase
MTNQVEISTSCARFTGYFSRAEKQSSPLVVFLHGFPDDHRIWDLQLSELKDIADLWAPDIYQHSFRSQVQGLVEMIKREKTGRKIILVAHDMGGPLACEVARKEKGLVDQLLLINTFSIEHFIHRCAQPVQLLRSSYMPWLSGPLHKTEWWKMFAKQFVTLAYNRGGIPNDDPIRGSINLEVIEGVKRYREIGKELPGHFSLTPRTLEVETHFLFGKDDPFLVPPSEKDLKRYYQLATIDFLFTGHWPQRTYAEDVNRKIKELVSL